jgi:predicted PhzF superfamily epimerase YddE/YHI9
MFMKIMMYQVDAFTDHVFGGNPAAVCVLDTWIDEKLMQNIAAENNLSETAFIVEEQGRYAIRWFTPEIEVDLCGHATLASAHVVFSVLDQAANRLDFQYSGGMLHVERSGALLRLNLPATPPVQVELPESVYIGLGRQPVEIWKSRDYMAVFSEEKEVLELRPDFVKLAEADAVGIIATAPGSSADFVSRFFAPAAGIAEDPVTGSAHCTLIPYWSEKLDKHGMKAYQASRRGGWIACENLGDRVVVAGHAVTYMQGEIYV